MTTPTASSAHISFQRSVTAANIIQAITAATARSKRAWMSEPSSSGEIAMTPPATAWRAGEYPSARAVATTPTRHTHRQASMRPLNALT